MSDQAEEPTIDIDEFFGVEQTDGARLEVKVSYSALYQGRPYYPEARYSDGPRMQVIGDGDEQDVVVESEGDLRDRVIGTALRALSEVNAATLNYLNESKSAPKGDQ